MKIKEDFVLRQVADTWVVLPLAVTAVDFNGMLKLNESGAMLWRILEHGSDMNTLVDALTTEYDVSEEQAKNDVKEFLDMLTQVGCVEG